MEFTTIPSRPQAPISSALSPFTTHQFLLLRPSSAGRDFLGRGSRCGSSSKFRPLPPPPGLRRFENKKKQRKKSGIPPQSPQCTLQSFPYESFALAAAATAIAAQAAYQVTMMNLQPNEDHKKSRFPQFSGPQVLDILSRFGLCEQGLNIGTQNAVGSEFFVLNSGYTNQFVNEEGGNAIERIQESQQIRAGKKDCIKISYDRIPMNVHELLQYRNNGRQRQSAREPSGCSEKEEPDLNSISCFGSLSTKPLQLVLQEKYSSCSQLRHATKLAEISEETTGSSEGEEPNAYFRVNSSSMRMEPRKVRGLPRDIDRSLRSKIEETVFSVFPQPNKNFSKHAIHPASYIKTYNLLLRDGRLKECVDLLESMERSGLLEMDKVHHISFLKVCKDQKAVPEAFRFCKLIRNPTMSTFNMLLSVCASSQDFEGAFQVMLLIKDARLKPDCKLYTTLISTCAKSGKVDAMFEVFHEMVNAGVEPNVNTYGALIDGCARAGQVAKAFGAYGIMRSKKVQPDRVVFNALITACGESGAVDRAFDVLAEMKAEPKPIEPDHITVGALMKACNKAGQVDRTREVYNMLQEYNIRGTAEVYTIAVKSCSQIGDLDFALKIYDDMKKNGVAPDEMFLSTLVDVAGHAGKVDTAFKVLQDARTEGIKVGNMSYSSLMGACCNAKNWKKALELYEEIKAMKLLPTVSTLNALVTSLCEGGEVRKSVEILDEMKKLGVQPNVITYSVLIVACEKNGEAELGFTLFSDAKKNNILPNLIMCRCLTGLCLQSFKKAYSLGEPLIVFHSGRPQIDCKWTSLAIQVYRETVQAGIKPSIEVFSQVLGCLQFPHDCSLRNAFIENLGFSSDASKCSNISSLLDGFGEYDTRCFSILEDAITLGVVQRVSFKEGPIVLDARKLLVYIVEVYLLTILKGLKHRLAAGAKLPNINILLPTEKTEIEFTKGETTINVAGRIGQAVGSLLRRMGLPYQGDESYGKIRIIGIALRRWFKPKLTTTSPFAGRHAEMISNPTLLAKGIMDQQRSIRNSNNLSLD